MRAILAVCCVLIPMVVAADSPVVFITKDGTGLYWDGKSNKSIPVRVVFPDGEIPPTGGGEDPDKPDIDTTTLKGRVQQAAAKGPGDEGAGLLAGVYGFIAKSIESGKIPPTLNEINKATKSFPKEAIDLIPGGSSVKDSWTEIDEEITALLSTELLKLGTTPDKDDVVSLFRQVEAGLNAAAGEGELSDKFFQVLLERLLEILLERLLDLFALDSRPQLDRARLYAWSRFGYQLTA